MDIGLYKDCHRCIITICWHNGILRNGPGFCETGFCETVFGETGFCETGFGETGFGETGFGETGGNPLNNYNRYC